MPTTYYYSVNDEIIGEHTLGQSRLDYIPDALGSVVASVDQTLSVKSTARYKPYGADLATTGTQPAYGYTGISGSRRTGRPHSDLYNRARHLATTNGRWTTVDPMWPYLPVFEYGHSRPTTVIDPSGLLVVTSNGMCDQSRSGTLSGCCRSVSPTLNPDQRAAVMKCMNSGFPTVAPLYKWSIN